MKTLNDTETMNLLAAAISLDSRLARCRCIIAAEDTLEIPVMSVVGAKSWWPAAECPDLPEMEQQQQEPSYHNKALVLQPTTLSEDARAQDLATALSGRLATAILGAGLDWPSGFDALSGEDARLFLVTARVGGTVDDARVTTLYICVGHLVPATKDRIKPEYLAVTWVTTGRSGIDVLGMVPRGTNPEAIELAHYYKKMLAVTPPGIVDVHVGSCLDLAKAVAANGTLSLLDLLKGAGAKTCGLRLEHDSPEAQIIYQKILPCIAPAPAPKETSR